MKRYILTGTPGAGKTAILRWLECDGYTVVEEAATGVIPAGAEYGCVSAPSRTRGDLSVDLVLLTDQHQRADCIAGGTIGVNRKLSLYRDGKLVGEEAVSRADFSVRQATGVRAYRAG